MIGVDRVAERMEAAMKNDGDRSYPPHDIEKIGGDTYRITLATAGFSADDLDVVAQPNLLIVTGRVSEEQEGHNYLHRGISVRAFERRFELADFVVVKSAAYNDGLLKVDLTREVPEALKPRRIEIDYRDGASAGAVTDARRAA
jgi:molecular chaperone IbpA